MRPIPISTAKLIDVCPPNSDYPEGFAMNLTDGIFRLPFSSVVERARVSRIGPRL